MYSKLLIVFITLIAAKLVITNSSDPLKMQVVVIFRFWNSLRKPLTVTSRRARQLSLWAVSSLLTYYHCQHCVIGIHFSSRSSSHYSAYLHTWIVRTSEEGVLEERPVIVQTSSACRESAAQACKCGHIGLACRMRQWKCWCFWLVTVGYKLQMMPRIFTF